ncbi:hypothetical protein AYO41_04400 [Verrucomicrobia bacterium SCGC AG-212-E04]|nr:hypothetical protein AYO41_04400 [Verrucomicrobia bacterium SCGC AG-212-E04]
MEDKLKLVSPPKAHWLKFGYKMIGQGQQGMARDGVMHAVISSRGRTGDPFPLGVENAILDPQCPKVGGGPDALLEEVIGRLDVTSLAYALYFPKKRPDILNVFGDVGAINEIKALPQDSDPSRTTCHS